MALDNNGDRLPAMYDIWGFYEDPDTGEFSYMKFGSYNGQSGMLIWDDEALLNYAGITRPES